MPLTPGSNFGTYRIIGPLGRGGMASVYKAYEAGLDRYVALKVLPAEFLHESDFSARFNREAKTIAKLEHHHIVPIYAFGIAEGIPWMAMRLVVGGTVSELLRKGRLGPARIVAILGEVAKALGYAHEQGVLHRDVKPQNILLHEQGHVYLTDFGIAKIVEGSLVLSKTGMITGTPQYMSPEQARAEKVDHRADIYALGIVAYEMLVGRVPFTADTPVAVLMKHVMDPIPLPPETEVPEPVTRVLLKCLAKRPEDRWDSPIGFVTALENSLAGISTQPDGTEPDTKTVSLSAISIEVGTAVTKPATPPSPIPAPPVAKPRASRPNMSRIRLLAAVIVLVGLGYFFSGYFDLRGVPTTEQVGQKDQTLPADASTSDATHSSIEPDQVNQLPSAGVDRTTPLESQPREVKPAPPPINEEAAKPPPSSARIERRSPAESELTARKTTPSPTAEQREDPPPQEITNEVPTRLEAEAEVSKPTTTLAAEPSLDPHPPAEIPRAPEPATAVVPQTGAVEISANPGTEIYVDGELAGTIPPVPGWSSQWVGTESSMSYAMTNSRRPCRFSVARRTISPIASYFLVV